MSLLALSPALAACGRKGALVDFKWPRGDGSGNGSARRGQLRIMFQMIQELSEQEGFTPEGELAALWASLAEQLGVELPVTV